MKRVWAYASVVIDVVIVIFLLLYASTILPPAWAAGEMALHINNPVKVVQYQLARLPWTDYDAKIGEALNNRDPELARAILDLAHARGLTVKQELIQRLALAEHPVNKAKHAAKEIGAGIVYGKGTSNEAMAAAIVADLTSFGDARDLFWESRKDEPDRVVVLLASAGLIMTLGTVVSLGSSSPATLPVKSGVSILKFLRKAGKLSKRLAEQLTGLARDAINAKAMHALMGRARQVMKNPLAWSRLVQGKDAQLNGLAAKVIRWEKVGPLKAAARDIKAINDSSGLRATATTLEAAQDIAHISRLTRISGTFKQSFIGVLKLVPTAGKVIHKTSGFFLGLMGLVAIGILWVILASVFSIRVMRRLWIRGWRIAGRWLPDYANRNEMLPAVGSGPDHPKWKLGKILGEG